MSSTTTQTQAQTLEEAFERLHELENARRSIRERMNAGRGGTYVISTWASGATTGASAPSSELRNASLDTLNREIDKQRIVYLRLQIASNEAELPRLQTEVPKLKAAMDAADAEYRQAQEAIKAARERMNAAATAHGNAAHRLRSLENTLPTRRAELARLESEQGR